MLIKKNTLMSLSFAVLLTACGVTHVHEEGHLPDAKVSYIKGIPGWNPLFAAGVQIYRIDGEKVRRRNNTFELIPGDHTIAVRCVIDQPEHISKSYVFTLNMKAGHTYRPKLDMTEECGLKFIDVNTGAVYSGQLN